MKTMNTEFAPASILRFAPRFAAIGLLGLLGSTFLPACAAAPLDEQEQEFAADSDDIVTNEAESALLRCGWGCPAGEHAEALGVTSPSCPSGGTVCEPNTSAFWHCSATGCPAGWHMEARRCDAACGTCPNGFNSSYCVANADVTFDQCISPQSCPSTGYRTIHSICVNDSPCGPCRYGMPNEQTCERVP